MSGVCPACARRTWLLGKLSVQLDFKARDLSRFWSLLQLSDLELIEAIGGRRRPDLHAEYAAWEPSQAQEKAARQEADAHENAGLETTSVCLHHPAYPRILREDPLAPHALSLRGAVESLAHALERKVVAIVGTRRASDYGMEVARGLGRGLAASGLTVASGLDEGIAAAVHAGALEARGSTLTVTAHHMQRCSPAWCAPLYRRIVESGCAICEARASDRARRWWETARTRTLALLSELVIVVEADERPWELACAHVAWSHGRHVAAVPGRVSSSMSRGTNSLLMDGARLVRSTQDALDVLYGVGMREAGSPPSEAVALEPRLARVLERVGHGEDTIEKLATADGGSQGIPIALAELELCGMLVRGDGGRYVPSSHALTG